MPHVHLHTRQANKPNKTATSQFVPVEKTEVNFRTENYPRLVSLRWVSFLPLIFYKFFNYNQIDYPIETLFNKNNFRWHFSFVCNFFPRIIFGEQDNEILRFDILLNRYDWNIFKIMPTKAEIHFDFVPTHHQMDSDVIWSFDSELFLCFVAVFSLHGSRS